MAEIESEAGVVPAAGVTLSHLAFEEAETAAVKAMGDTAPIASVCEAGAGPPTGDAKESCAGVTSSCPGPDTVSVTAI